MDRSNIHSLTLTVIGQEQFFYKKKLIDFLAYECIKLKPSYNEYENAVEIGNKNTDHLHKNR